MKAPERDSDVRERGEHGVGAQSLDLARERVQFCQQLAAAGGRDDQPVERRERVVEIGPMSDALDPL